MTLKLVAVDGCTLNAIGVSNEEFLITTLPSTKTKVDGDGVYAGGLAFSFTNGDYGSWDDGTAFGGSTIPPTAEYTKDDDKEVMREDDDVELTMSGTQSGNPVSTLITVEISVAGQTFVKAE